MTTVCMRWSPGRKQSCHRVSKGGFDAQRYAVAAVAEAEADEVPELRRPGVTDPEAGD